MVQVGDRQIPVYLPKTARAGAVPDFPRIEEVADALAAVPGSMLNVVQAVAIEAAPHPERDGHANPLDGTVHLYPCASVGEQRRAGNYQAMLDDVVMHEVTHLWGERIGDRRWKR